ncbi:MAG: hypothetical protein EOP34_10065 [Rickettsiales bacterium]|nr:MAG: hypothetical protein EOP34_10065 [Rickettsiales bacterium]
MSKKFGVSDNNFSFRSINPTQNYVIYYKGINKNIIYAISQVLLFSYNSRKFIDFVNEPCSEKCSIDHPLYTTVLSLIDKNNCFADLDNIDVFIINSNDRNAFACGFGKSNPAIYVCSGLIECFDNNYSDNRLKAILAHELGHISGSHSFINTMVYTSKVITDHLLPKFPLPFISGLVGNLIDSSMSCLSRQIEYDADQTAVDCGFGPDLFDALIEIVPTSRPHRDSFKFGLGLELEEIFASHPSIYNRAAAINAHLMEQNTEYDNWYDWFSDSISHTFSRFIDQSAIHYEAYSRMIGLTEELNQYRIEHI